MIQLSFDLVAKGVATAAAYGIGLLEKMHCRKEAAPSPRLPLAVHLPPGGGGGVSLNGGVELAGSQGNEGR